MGKPINPDNTLDYDSPAPTPTRLTDEAAEYVAPSAGAMELSRQFCQLLNDDGDGALDWFLVEAATLVDAFATQQAAAAVEAERAELVEWLDFKITAAQRAAEKVRQQDAYTSDYETYAEAITAAFNEVVEHLKQ